VIAVAQAGSITVPHPMILRLERQRSLETLGCTLKVGTAEEEDAEGSLDIRVDDPLGVLAPC
jgi:hypothetical protein